MAIERWYIYRDGMTDACALTSIKNAPPLPSNTESNGWQFWMQISRFQEEQRRFGFDLQVATADIAAKGYSLFTGSANLLAARLQTPSAPYTREGTSNG